ncbi:xylan esterase [Paenibacillus sp. J31TS4]|uniref:acetylxylan esterase n=1 Tax=Paenibacillus sp. J31TS4 TaxID=2807195 RepID=UPI001B183A9B|nr:acetylxylan esterase [Paenibacillus sp. J31TS4]GIP37182.1 xylan esterase [Paenibacillus sp. J31TS4]
MGIRSLETYKLTLYDVREQLKRHVYRRSLEAFAEGDRARDAIRDRRELEERQAYMRTKWTQNVGSLPDSSSPLQAEVTGIVPMDGFRIEKLVFQSRPREYVTGNLYVPEGNEGRRGAVLFLCGHHELAKHHPEYQTVCQVLVRAGLVVLAIDPIGQGERLSYYEPALGAPTVRPCTGEHDYVGTQCLPLGDSLARYFVHDAMRAVDYLQSRPEVDPERIGVTGNSGGGTQASMLMICDPRLAAAAPATFLMSRESYLLAGGAQDAEQIWPGMSALGFDHEDILLAMAPKPVLVLAAKYDFFPIEGTRRSVRRAARLWELLGFPDDLILVEEEAVHQYTPGMAEAAAQFFTRHLLNEEARPDASQVRVLEPSALWCTAGGQVRAAYPDARTVRDVNADRAAEFREERNLLPEPDRRRRAALWLREQVMADRRPCELNPRLYLLKEQSDGFEIYNAIWRSQEDVFNHAFLFRDIRFRGETLPVTIALWEDGTRRLQPHMAWLRRTCAAGRAVAVLDVSGTGALTPHALNGGDPKARYEILHKLTDDLIWLGDSLAAMRVYDTLRAAEAITRFPLLQQEGLRLFASGRPAMYARLAAALDPRLATVETVEEEETVEEWVTAQHYEAYDRLGYVLPGLLRFGDLGDFVPQAGKP